MKILSMLNTKIENTGYLSAIGDFGMAPCRALWNGKTVTVVDQTVTDVTPSTMMSTASAIALLIPGLFLGLIFKFLAHCFADVREKHAFAQVVSVNLSESDESTNTNCNENGNVSSISVDNDDITNIDPLTVVQSQESSHGLNPLETGPFPENKNVSSVSVDENHKKKGFETVNYFSQQISNKILKDVFSEKTLSKEEEIFFLNIEDVF